MAAGCSNSPQRVSLSPSAPNSAYSLMYGPQPEEQFPLPGIDYERLPSQFLRKQVDYETDEAVGTLIVDTGNFHCYLVQENGKAMRYGVGLGRQGFEWSGRARIAYKRAWPRWTPPDEMIEREPELERYSVRNGGMDPGPENPLGARALYIFEGNVDTLYRLHGTSEFWTIGRAVSSGCVRFINQDIIDLHRRVPNGTPLLVT